MSVYPDMLEPADMPAGTIDDLQRMVDKLFRNYPWLRDVLAALPKENEPEPSLWQRIAATDRRVLALELAPDLEQRVKDMDARLRFIEDALGDEVVFTASGATKEIEELNRRLAVLEDRLSPRAAGVNPAPDQPLKVGDEVWVRGKLMVVDKGLFRVDFPDDTAWLCKDTEIKRA
jgi:hypothetical protein